MAINREVPRYRWAEIRPKQGANQPTHFARAPCLTWIESFLSSGLGTGSILQVWEDSGWYRDTERSADRRYGLTRRTEVPQHLAVRAKRIRAGPRCGHLTGPERAFEVATGAMLPVIER
jgi:hypothetical protein